MNDSILIAVLIILVQLFDSYLRWLAFSKEISKELSLKIWRKIFICSAVTLGIYILKNFAKK